MIKYLTMATILTAPMAASATGVFQCEEVAASAWLTEDATSKIVTDLGWDLRKMKQDGGCWEVYATMPDGVRMEAYLHPATGAVQYIGQRGKVIYDIREDADGDYLK